MADLRALVERVREARKRADLTDRDTAQDWLDRIGQMQAAERALCDALLTSRAVEAVEVLRAYGWARAADDWGYDVDAEWMRVAALADALAEEVGRGESDADKLSRVQLMASGSETWDLSRNDVAVLKYVLTALTSATERAERVERERDALASEAVDRLMLVATLRTRAEQAEAELSVMRDELASVSAEFGLPPAIRPAEGEIARMMGRARRTEQAERERDEARDQRDGSFEDVASLNGCLERATARAEAAEAEVARLRGEYERGLREAADVARAHGGISAYYAITKLAAEVEPAAEGE